MRHVSFLGILVKRDTLSKLSRMAFDQGECHLWCWRTGLNWWCGTVWGQVVGGESLWDVWPCCRLLKPWAPWWDGGEYWDCESRVDRWNEGRGMQKSWDGLGVLMAWDETDGETRACCWSSVRWPEWSFLVNVCKCWSTESQSPWGYKSDVDSTTNPNLNSTITLP